MPSNHCLLTLMPSHLETALRGRNALSVLIAFKASASPISNHFAITMMIDICRMFKYLLIRKSSGFQTYIYFS